MLSRRRRPQLETHRRNVSDSDSYPSHDGDSSGVENHEHAHAMLLLRSTEDSILQQCYGHPLRKHSQFKGQKNCMASLCMDNDSHTQLTMSSPSVLDGIGLIEQRDKNNNERKQLHQCSKCNIRKHFKRKQKSQTNVSNHFTNLENPAHRVDQ